AGIKPSAIVLEPVARNTAPAIAVAALLVERRDPTGTLVVMPSDHSIKDTAAFIEAVQRAAKLAAASNLVLFGITPDKPHTGYGYIARGTPLEGCRSAFSVQKFSEKP